MSEREAFEAVFRPAMGSSAFEMRRVSPVTPEFEYKNRSIEHAWIGWQAARADVNELRKALQCAQNVLSLLSEEVKALGCRGAQVPEMIAAALAKADGEQP